MDTLKNNTFACNSVNTLLLEGSCKIMEGKYGGGFYARYRFDKGRGNGFIELLLQYPDNTVVPVPLCKNVCRITDTDGDGIGTAKPIVPNELQTIFQLEEKNGKKLREIIPSMKDAVSHSSQKDYEQFVKYERPDFPIPIKVIWKRIIEHWEQLPIKTWNCDGVLDDVYSSLIAVGENKVEENSQFADNTGVYLTKDEIEDVIESFGVDFKNIRKIFEIRNLWIKDSATAGYQFTKKINGKNQRFYKLRKIGVDSKVAVKTDFCIGYTE